MFTYLVKGYVLRFSVTRTVSFGGNVLRYKIRNRPTLVETDPVKYRHPLPVSMIIYSPDYHLLFVINHLPLFNGAGPVTVKRDRFF